MSEEKFWDIISRANSLYKACDGDLDYVKRKMMKYVTLKQVKDISAFEEKMVQSALSKVLMYTQAPEEIVKKYIYYAIQHGPEIFYEYTYSNPENIMEVPPSKWNRVSDVIPSIDDFFEIPENMFH